MRSEPTLPNDPDTPPGEVPRLVRYVGFGGLAVAVAGGLWLWSRYGLMVWLTSAYLAICG